MTVTILKDDIEIYKDTDGKLNLSFTLHSPNENMSVLLKSIYESLIQNNLGNDAKIQKNKWQECDEGLKCRLLEEKIEIKDISEQNNSSNLVLIPAILLDREIISEDNKDELHEWIVDHTLVKDKFMDPTIRARNAAVKEFARKSAEDVFVSRKFHK